MRWLLLCATLALWSCTGEPSPSRGDPTAGDGASNGDPSNGDPRSGDPAEGDTGPGEDFAIRLPLPHVMTCDGGTGSTTISDTDHLCAIPALGVEVYIQATPTSCVEILAERPYFDDVGGWVKRNGVVNEIPAAYDAGHHGNDVIHFELDGTVYFIWHSSFGYGWRACAPPDCLVTCGSNATFETCGPSSSEWQTDGCARDTGEPPPPAPVTCVQVEITGAPELLDPWDSTPGAPYPLLPCIGDI